MESLMPAQAFVVPFFKFDQALVVVSLTFCQAFVATSLVCSNGWVTDIELVSLAVEFSSAAFDCLQPVAKVAMTKAASISGLLFIICHFRLLVLTEFASLAKNLPSFKIKIKISLNHLLPRRGPLFFPPPVTLLTVAHARFSDSLLLTPCFS